MTSSGPGTRVPSSDNEGWRGVFGLEKRVERKGDIEQVQVEDITGIQSTGLGAENGQGRTSLTVESKDISSSTFSQHPINIDPNLNISSTPPSHTYPSSIPPVHIPKHNRPFTSPTTTNSRLSPPFRSPHLAPPILLPANQPRWIEPLASAILAPTSASGGLHTRRNSDPTMGVVQFRRRELQLAAEELYKETQMRL